MAIGFKKPRNAPDEPVTVIAVRPAGFEARIVLSDAWALCVVLSTFFFGVAFGYLLGVTR